MKAALPSMLSHRLSRHLADVCLVAALLLVLALSLRGVPPRGEVKPVDAAARPATPAHGPSAAGPPGSADPGARSGTVGEAPG